MVGVQPLANSQLVNVTMPLRLHQIENEFRRSVAAVVRNANRRIIAVGNRLDPNFAFERRVGVIQDRIDRMRRVAIAGQNLLRHVHLIQEEEAGSIPVVPRRSRH